MPPLNPVRLRSLKLQEFLFRRNISLTEFAASVHITKQYVWELMHEHKRPSPKIRRAMQSAYPDVPWDDFFYIDKKALPKTLLRK